MPKRLWAVNGSMVQRKIISISFGSRSVNQKSLLLLLAGSSTLSFGICWPDQFLVPANKGFNKIQSIFFQYCKMSEQQPQQSFEGWTPAQIQEYYSKWQDYYTQMVRTGTLLQLCSAFSSDLKATFLITLI